MDNMVRLALYLSYKIIRALLLNKSTGAGLHRQKYVGVGVYPPPRRIYGILLKILYWAGVCKREERRAQAVADRQAAWQKIVGEY